MNKERYRVQCVAPDGHTDDYYYETLKEAVIIANRVNICRGWQALILVKNRKGWSLLIG